MAQICSSCLTTTPHTIQGMCPPCQRAGDRTRRPSSSVRYPAEYQRNRAIILHGNPLCYWGCGRPATTADHLIPRAQGGSHDLTNLVPACGPCNSARGGRDDHQGEGRVKSSALYCAGPRPPSVRNETNF